MIGYILIGFSLGVWLTLVVALGARYIDERRENRRPEKKRDPFRVHGCHDCKHTNKSYDEEPCCYCDLNSEWEAKE